MTRQERIEKARDKLSEAKSLIGDAEDLLSSVKGCWVDSFSDLLMALSTTASEIEDLEDNLED